MTEGYGGGHYIIDGETGAEGFVGADRNGRELLRAIREAEAEEDRKREETDGRPPAWLGPLLIFSGCAAVVGALFLAKWAADAVVWWMMP